MHRATTACRDPRLHDKLIDEFLRSLVERHEPAAHLVCVARANGGFHQFLYLGNHFRQLIQVVADAAIHRIVATQVANEAAEETIFKFRVASSNCALEAVYGVQARPHGEGDEFAGRSIFGKRIPKPDHYIKEGLRFVFILKAPPSTAPQMIDLLDGGYACHRAVDRAPKPHTHDRRRKGAVIPLQHVSDVRFNCHDGNETENRFSVTSTEKLVMGKAA